MRYACCAVIEVRKAPGIVLAGCCVRGERIRERRKRRIRKIQSCLRHSRPLWPLIADGRERDGMGIGQDLALIDG